MLTRLSTRFSTRLTTASTVSLCAAAAAAAFAFSLVGCAARAYNDGAQTEAASPPSSALRCSARWTNASGFPAPDSQEGTVTISGMNNADFTETTKMLRLVFAPSAGPQSDLFRKMGLKADGSLTLYRPQVVSTPAWTYDVPDPKVREGTLRKASFYLKRSGGQIHGDLVFNAPPGETFKLQGASPSNTATALLTCNAKKSAPMAGSTSATPAEPSDVGDLLPKPGCYAFVGAAELYRDKGLPNVPVGDGKTEIPLYVHSVKADNALLVTRKSKYFCGATGTLMHFKPSDFREPSPAQRAQCANPCPPFEDRI